MTEQKPEEYVITEAQLQAISWALGKLSKNNQLLKEIRSRPLSEEIRKAREDVLDKIETYIKGLGMSNSDKAILFSIINSLRGGKS